jgi:hypothetical protein
LIANEKTAKQIVDLMFEIYRQMQESVDAVKETCAAEEHRLYNLAVGRVVSSIMVEVLDPLYRENAALKPTGWDD